jgi:FlaA1/EpsC-like NDP-sugar epimerase
VSLSSLLINNRIWIILLLKVAITLGSFLAAFAIRFDLSIPAEYWPRILSLLPPLLAVKIIVFWHMGLFRGWWRYVSMSDLIQLFKGNLFASLVFALYVALVYRMEHVPRSVLIIDGVFSFLFAGGVRFATRAFRENHFPMFNGNNSDAIRVLVVGAGEGGRMIAREIRANARFKMALIGFVDDDPRKRNVIFHGAAVLGSTKDLGPLIVRHRVAEIIIAIPAATGAQIRAIVDQCRLASVTFKILPDVEEMISGRMSLQQIREVDLKDLLGRETISLDKARISNYLQGKRVLVTGAGGSIGSELCRQVACFKPDKLILFENAETPLFHIEQDLKVNFPEIHIVPIIGDVRHRSRVVSIFDEQLPQVVFHAAAYKHVPMMELNPAEAVNNNINGSRIVADAAHTFGVDTFVLVSTDKAVRPTNVMGASKRISELYIQSLSTESKTRFVTTRFGNVLGSNGSVIPTFQEQIKAGGPITVTDPEVTRFFMTIAEAAQLVLQAGCMGQGGEIFLFDMGEPVRIVTLAEELIRLSGLRPYEDIEITFTGLRPGEKLYEELLLAEEGTLPTHHEKICIAKSSIPPRPMLVAEIDKLVAAAKNLDYGLVKAGLRKLVPEYSSDAKRPRAKIIPHPAVTQYETGTTEVSG